MTIDELRIIIDKLDNRPNGGINYIAIFSVPTFLTIL